MLVASVRLLYNNSTQKAHRIWYLTRTQPTREPAATRLRARAKAIVVIALVVVVNSHESRIAPRESRLKVRLLVRLGYYQNSWRVALSLSRRLLLSPLFFTLERNWPPSYSGKFPTHCPPSPTLSFGQLTDAIHTHTTTHTRAFLSMSFGERARKTKSNLWHLFSLSLHSYQARQSGHVQVTFLRCFLRAFGMTGTGSDRFRT